LSQVRSEFIIMRGSALTGVVFSVPCHFCLYVLCMPVTNTCAFIRSFKLFSCCYQML